MNSAENEVVKLADSSIDEKIVERYEKRLV